MSRWKIDYGVETLYLEHDPPLTSEALHSLETNMLRFNCIPGLLPLDLEEIDLELKLAYRIGRRKPLTERLKLDPLSSLELFRLLYSIAMRIQQADNYMLSEEGFMVREDLIFVSADYHDIALVYAPVRTREPNELGKRMRMLFYYGLGYVSEVRGTSIQQCLIYINSGDFHLPEWISRLQEWIASLETKPLPLYTEVPAPTRVQEQPLIRQPVKLEETSFPMVRELWETGPITELPEVGEGNDNRQTRRIMAALFVLSSAVWGLFAMQPSWNAGYAAFAVQLVLGAFAYSSWKYRWLARLVNEEKHVKVQDHKDGFLADYRINSEEASITASSMAYPEHNRMDQTAFLQNPQQTVLLRPNEVTGGHNEPILERISDTGHPIRTETVHKTPYVIGRGEHCDWMLEESGISRRHLEIEYDGACYCAKDLGSSNGTFVNGERLIPFKGYPLTGGDKIKMIGIEWRFRLP
jgi:hypothetical protein